MQYDIIKFIEDVAELKLQGGKITGLKTQKIQKSSARVFKNGQIFSSAIIGNVSAAQLLESADKRGNVGISYEYGLPQTRSLKSIETILESREVGIQKYRSFLSHILKKYPKLNWSGSAKFRKLETQFTSSYTEELYSSGESVELNFLYKKFGSTEFAEGFFAISGNEYNFMDKLKKFESIIDAAEHKASIESKKMPVLLLDEWDIIKRISEDVRPEKYNTGSSYLSGKLGQTVFHQDVTFQDIGFSPRHGNFTKFDSEGVLHQNTQLFTQGVFSGFIYDLRQAHKYHAQSTGNGFRQYNTGVTCKPNQLSLKPGQTSMWEMLNSVPECLVVVLGYGGAINEQWDYSTPVQVGILFKNGKPAGRVPSLSIKGRLNDFLGKDLIGISSDGYNSDLSPAILTQLEVIVH
ncbi:MAG: metallopeptidase TldD-related protein [Pseudobdellovibrionaceae bacterium]